MEVSLREQRIQNIMDATNLKEPEKVPVGIEVLTWPLSYAGVRYADIMHNPPEVAKAYTKFLDDIDLDYYIMLFGITNSMGALKELGSEKWVLSEEDGNTVTHNQVDEQYMEPEEYDELIADYDEFFFKMVRKRFPNLDKPFDEAYEAFKKAAIEQRYTLETNNLINDVLVEKSIVPIAGMGPDVPPMFWNRFNELFDSLRGIKGALGDLRRRPDKVKAAMDAMTSGMHIPVSTMEPEDLENKRPYPFGTTGYHCECFLNNKQFDELFFQNFKALALPYMEKGAKYFLKGEGAFLNHIERYLEFPKGSMVIMLDQDDPFEAYKLVGNYHTLMTGITGDLLKSGTKQQCIDYVKKCFDTFAPGGGFMFAPNKPLISPADVNVENLIAVYEFANEYGKKK